MISSPVPIYHITSIDNLPSILGSGCLVCPNMHPQDGIAYTSIAHSTIQAVRTRKRIPCGPGGVLHDYVPFYFAPRSPMLYSLHNNFVEGYSRGQRPIIHLVSSVEAVQGASLPYVFSEGQGIVALTRFFDDPKDLDKIDWGVMPLTMWRDTIQDGDRKRRRQAEFLVFNTFPWSLVHTIGVVDTVIKRQVDNILEEYAIRPFVACHPGWYY